jgi:hypothetical protein
MATFNLKPNLKALALALALLAASATGASAGDATRGWGTLRPQTPLFIESAQMHELLSTSAQAESAGRESVFRNVTSCGVCVTFTIQGNNNSIDSNTIRSTNSGSLSANGSFSGL